MSRTKQLQWSYSAGERGRNRTRVYERLSRGDTMLEWYERDALGRLRRSRQSLGRCTREWAKAKADEVAARFSLAASTAILGKPTTVRTLFETYEREITPRKVRSGQRHDRLVFELFQRLVGADRPVARLTRADWNRFIRDRQSGVLGPAGCEKPKRVRDRQVAYDLMIVRAAINWGMAAMDTRGNPLVDRNPFAGFPLPHEENPRRPLLSDAEYQACYAVRDQVHPLCALALVLAHETGHRIGAIRMLRWADVDWTARTVRWRAENDKIEFEHVTPLTDAAVEVLEGERKRSAGIGESWIFPAFRQPSEPRNGDLMRHWWRDLEKKAGLPRARGRGWHSLRRAFATEMKHAPLRDLAYLGGWKSVATVVTVYQQPDHKTMRDALTQRRVMGAPGPENPPTDTTNRHQAVGPGFSRMKFRRANNI